MLLEHPARAVDELARRAVAESLGDVVELHEPLPVALVDVPAEGDAPRTVLVGFGSVWGNGCTSGHGICGLSRLSLRSLVATLVFMTTAIVTVFVTRHLM